MSIRVKMSQIDDSYDQAWSNPPSEKETLQKPPEAPLPKEPDTGAEDLAKAWHGDMVRVAPYVFLEPRTLEQFNMMKALGFSLSSKDEVLRLANDLIDSTVLYDDISWFNDSEWDGLLKFLQTGKAASAVVPSYKISINSAVKRSSVGSLVLQAQIQPSQLKQLLHALEAANFEVFIDSDKTADALRLLSKSPNSPYAQVASAIFGMSHQDRINLFNEFEAESQQSALSKFPQPEKQVVPELKKPEVVKQEPTEESVNWVGSHKSKDLQMGEFYNNFDMLIDSSKEQIEPTQLGQPVGLKIQNIGSKTNDYPVKAGEFVRNNNPELPNGENNGMVLGAKDGSLVVAVFPSGNISSGPAWDPKIQPIQRSRDRVKIPE